MKRMAHVRTFASRRMEELALARMPTSAQRESLQRDSPAAPLNLEDRAALAAPERRAEECQIQTAKIDQATGYDGRGR